MYWAKGLCRKGGSCTFNHSDSTYASVTRVGQSATSGTTEETREQARDLLSQRHSQQAKRVCEHYFAKGTCKFGQNCKFSHDASTQQITTETGLENRPGALLFKLKGMMRSFGRLGQFESLVRFQEFLETALKVLESNDREVQSEVVLVLGNNDRREDDTGYKLICHVVEQIGCPVPHHFILNPLKELDYARHLVPFMKIVVHDAFSRSCVEKSFMFVIKAIYGPDGERGSKFLKTLVSNLENKCKQCEDDPDLQPFVEEGCFLVCRILNYIVRYNADAIGHSDLIDIHSRLREVSAMVRTPLSPRMDRYLAETAAYLIPVTFTPGTEQLAEGSNGSLNVRYHQRQFLTDLPGELSSTNSRHDNDSALIAKINVLPTQREVLCERDPYLPINHISAPHFLEGPPRLFDINFRLLREDMIGPLRNAVTTIHRKLGTGSAHFSHQDRRRDPNIASTRLYSDVTVEAAQFDRKCGLKFRLRFRQPNLRTELSAAGRKNYWEATRSLDKGSLLCLISTATDFICFVTVVEKQLNLLIGNPDWCSIDVILEGKIHHVQDQLLKYIRLKRPSESLALVEFPGVLLVAYKAILESLQARSNRPFLPFSNLLCPKPDERLTYNPSNPRVHVTPPLYASSARFQFDLQPLKTSDASPEPLFLFAEASPDDQELLMRLESQTTLDFGQCKGLVAALTREVALVQGTGHKFL